MPLPYALTKGIVSDPCCPICGFLILDARDCRLLFKNLEDGGFSSSPSSEWLGDIRAFRLQEPYLSGVGRIDRSLHGFRACTPSNPSKAYDHEDYHESEGDFFELRPFFPYYNGEPRNVGYPVHERCWQLLCFWAPVWGVENVSDARHVRFLYQLLHSTLDGIGSDWAGDYGGLLNDPSGALVQDATFDPFKIDAISNVMHKARAKKLPSRTQIPAFSHPHNPRTHCSRASGKRHQASPLSLLPLEILVMIVEQLPTRDVLRLWLASPAIPDTFPQRFWRSRFDIGMEFDYVFEAWPLCNVPDVDWYTMFWELKSLSCTGVRSQLRNRRRILQTIDKLAELVVTYENVLPGGNDDFADPILLETDGWVLHRKSLRLPAPGKFEALHISTVQLDGIKYISGLRVNDDPLELGYCLPGSSQTFRVASSHGSVREIRCHMDRIGLRGLSLVMENGWSTGIMPEMEMTESVSQGVLPFGRRLVAQLDAIKFKAIGIDCPLSPGLYTQNDILWRDHPLPEDVTVDLDHQFHSSFRIPYREPWHIRYNPLQYHVFDSDDSLIHIRGYVVGFTKNLVGLEFTYRRDDNTEKSVFFGRRIGSVFDFAIDSSGGERITKVRVSDPIVTVAPIITLYTNRGRSCMFSTVNEQQLAITLNNASVYAPKPGEHIAGLIWGTGGTVKDVESFWNFGIICRKNEDASTSVDTLL